MLIKEVSERTGLSKDTIRYYEKLGLIKVGKKSRRVNNYKEYSEDIIDRLHIVKRAKHLGFSLNEIKELIESWANKSLSKKERVELLKSRINLIDDKIKRLKEVRTYIHERIKQIKNER